MRYLKFVLLIIIFIAHLGCEKNTIENEEYKIITFFVNNVVPFPLPVPPSDPRENHMDRELLDSIMKNEITIGIFLEMRSYPKNIEPMREDSSFINLADNFNELKGEKIIDLSRIKQNVNRTLIGYDKINTKNMEYNDFDVALTFSRILINKDFNKSIVVVGEYRSELAGVTTLFFLMKEDNKWKIYKKRTLYIS